MEHDIEVFGSNVDRLLTHRLPTISAAQAAEELDDEVVCGLSTGIAPLDAFLSGSSSEDGDEDGAVAGIAPGQVIEVWGPPSAGKTTFGLQVAKSALKLGKGIVWIDCFHPVASTRVQAVCNKNVNDPDTLSTSQFRQHTCAELAHFLAAVCRPSPSTIPETTGLVVIDSLSLMLNAAFPRLHDAKGAGKKQASRRLQILEYITVALKKLAATQDLAIVVLSGCATKMHGDGGAVLTPAITAHAWDRDFDTRIVLYRDWSWDQRLATTLHLATVTKLDGVATNDVRSSTFAYDIDEDGLRSSNIDPFDTSGMERGLRKRTHGQAVIGLDPSDDEDQYGWKRDDEESMPRMPPQWQGSEDLLLTRPADSDEDSEPDSVVSSGQYGASDGQT